jgi:hypothetical protein
MRVLLDECVPKRLRSELTGHFVRTVGEMGWSGTKNGLLLQRAEPEFDCLLTVDRNLQFQQPLSSLQIAVLVIAAKTNRLEDLVPLMERVRECLKSLKPGAVEVVSLQ